MKPIIYDDLNNYLFAPANANQIKIITSSLSSFKGNSKIFHLYQTSKVGVLRRAYYTFSASSDNSELITFETENPFQGRIVFESTVKAGGEWSNGRQGVEPVKFVTASAFPSGNLLFEYSHDAKNWNTDAIFARATTFNGINNQQRLVYTFFHDKPYYFRLNLDPSTRVDGDFWGIKDILVYNIPEHRNNSNKLLFYSDNTNRPSGSKDNGFIQHQIPRTDLQYSWATGSLSLTSSITGVWNASSQEKLPSILGASGTNRTGQEEYLNTINANSQSFYFNRWAFNKLNAGLFNVNIDTNLIELSSSFSASFLTGSSNYFSTWNQIRTGENIIARRLRENNIISVALPPQQNNFLSNTNKTITNIAKRNDVVNYKEPVISDKNKPIKFRFIFKGNNNPHLAHEVKISYDNNTFANKDLKKRLGITERQSEAYKTIKNWLYNPNLPENENPIAKFLGYSIGEKIFPKDVNTGLAKTRARTKYLLNVPGFDRNGYDRQLGTQRVFWRDDVNNRIRSYSGSITSLGDFNNPINVTGTVKTGNNDFALAGNIAGETLTWGYTSSYSATLSSSYSSNTILPIDINNTINLLLTSSYIGTSIEDPDIGTLTGPSNITHSLRLNFFNDGGELNKFAWFDCFVTGANIPNVQGGSGFSLATMGIPLQLTRTSIYTLYNSFAVPGTGSDIVSNTAPYSPSLFYVESSASTNIFPKPSPRYCAFLGGFESGSRPWNYPNAPFESQPSSSLPISSTLDFGLRYAIDEMTSGSKRPWYNSYEAYLDNIRGNVKGYSIFPEFRLSDQMDFYISASNGNFRAKNTSFLSIDGIGIPSRSADIENTNYNEQFFRNYINSDTITNIETTRKDHDKLTKLEKINFKFFGIKKLLPYNGFYPIQRILQLVGLYKTSYFNLLDGAIYNFALLTRGNTNKTIEFSFTSPISGNISKNAVIQTALEPFFAPGILFNTIKAGISVDWPCITGSSISSLQDANLIFPENINMFYGVSGSIRSLINSRVKFENILNPENTFIVKSLPSSSYSKQLSLESLAYIYIADHKKWLDQVYFSSHFDCYNLFSNHIKGGLRSIPFVFKKINSLSSPLYSLAINNFLAEIPRFFLKQGQMNSFNSLEESRWNFFDSSKTYYFDLSLRKSQDLVMIQAYSSSNMDFYAGTDKKVVSASFNSMDGRYFGYPCAKTLLTGGLNNDQNTGTFIPASLIHHDPAYAPYTPPYFEGEAILRFSFTPQTSGKFTIDQVFSGTVLTDIFPALSAAVDPGSVAIANKMSIKSCVNIFGKTRKKEVEFDLFGKPKTIKDSVSGDKNVWVISPKMETPVLNFSNQPFKTLTGSYWSTGGFGRGMWSGYGSIPTGSQGIYLEIRDSFPHLIDQPGSNTGSLLRQVGFRPQSEKIGQLAEAKEISEAIVAIPYIDYEIVGKTTHIDGLNFIKISRELYNLQRRNVENFEAAIKLNDLGSQVQIQETSISRMIKLMEKYVFPPNFSFNIYDDIDPFIIYIAEFKHVLDQQDLADLWQAVMPKIAQTAESEDVIVEHPTGKFEFFEDQELPEGIRWMIFKVKFKPEHSYYNVTADQTEDSRFVFDFQIR